VGLGTISILKKAESSKKNDSAAHRILFDLGVLTWKFNSACQNVVLSIFS
jgi:hypothetical protein